MMAGRCPLRPVLVSIRVLHHRDEPHRGRHKAALRRPDVERAGCPCHRAPDKVPFVFVRAGRFMRDVGPDDVPVHETKDSFRARPQLVCDDPALVDFSPEPRPASCCLRQHIITVRAVPIAVPGNRPDAGGVILMILRETEACPVVLRPAPAGTFDLFEKTVQERLQCLSRHIDPGAVPV